MIKVKDLIKMLQKEDPERVVILQKDTEGNGFSPFDEIYSAGYVKYNLWSGEVYKDGVREDSISALVLKPTN